MLLLGRRAPIEAGGLRDRDQRRAVGIARYSQVVAAEAQLGTPRGIDAGGARRSPVETEAQRAERLDRDTPIALLDLGMPRIEGEACKRFEAGLRALCGIPSGAPGTAPAEAASARAA